MKTTILIAFALTTLFAVPIRAADVTNTPLFIPALEVTNLPSIGPAKEGAPPARTNLIGAPARTNLFDRRFAGSPSRFQSPPPPRRDWITITNGVLWPVPTGAAWINVTGPTELKLADFPDGAVLALAIRNPDNFPVFLAFNPTNTFVLTDQLVGAGRYLLHVQNVRGEIWITK